MSSTWIPCASPGPVTMAVAGAVISSEGQRLTGDVARDVVEHRRRCLAVKGCLHPRRSGRKPLDQRSGFDVSVCVSICVAPSEPGTAGFGKGLSERLHDFGGFVVVRVDRNGDVPAWIEILAIDSPLRPSLTMRLRSGLPYPGSVD